MKGPAVRWYIMYSVQTSFYELPNLVATPTYALPPRPQASSPAKPPGPSRPSHRDARGLRTRPPLRTSSDRGHPHSLTPSVRPRPSLSHALPPRPPPTLQARDQGTRLQKFVPSSKIEGARREELERRANDIFGLGVDARLGVITPRPIGKNNYRSRATSPPEATRRLLPQICSYRMKA